MSDISSDSADSDVAGPSRGRKRTWHSEKWVKSVVKTKHNTGQAYVSRATKEAVEARVVGPPCNDG